MKKAYFISGLTAIFLSAFIHLVDPDVNGIEGLLNLTNIISVLVWAVLPLLFMLAIQFTYVAWGKYYGLLAVALLAVFAAMGLNLLMTPSNWVSFLGSFLIFNLVFIVGAFLPAYFFSSKKHTLFEFFMP